MGSWLPTYLASFCFPSSRDKIFYNGSCTAKHSLRKWVSLHYHLLPPFQNKIYLCTYIVLRNKSYVWWSFSQISPNELVWCQKQCKCCCWWTTKSNNSLHLFNNWYLDSTASTHINPILCASVPSAQNGAIWLYYGHPQLAGKCVSDNYAMHVVSC